MRNSKKKDIKKVKVYSKKYLLNYNNFQVKLKRKKNTFRQDKNTHHKYIYISQNTFDKKTHEKY